MVKKKGKSHRTSLADKYKVQRRVLESHRKSRKQAKRDSKAGIFRHDKKKKDPGIPNSWPFKNELLNEVARARELAKTAKLDSQQNKSAKNLEELMARASASKAAFEAKVGISSAKAEGEGMKTPKQSVGQQSRRAYLSTLRKVIDTSDIILQVLDARDPMGTRIHPSIEDTILSHYDKKMVLVLNKIDLVPKDAVSGWLNFLRKSRPTLAMKCGTNIRDKVGRSEGEGALSSSCGVGVDGLLGLLKNYARTSGGGKTCITVGIVGYPNVGKSSILNTLKRSRAVGVSSRPGFTTTMQEVVLDRNIRLVDSPGVVFDDTESVNGAEAMLRNCVDADSVSDPIPAIGALLKRCSPESLMMTYSIPAFPRGDEMIFLAMIAKRNGKVLKGGIPDKVTAARGVLKDWNTGKIPFYTRPPTEEECRAISRATVQNDAKIVTGFGEAFDVDKLDAEVMDSLEEKDEMDFVQMAPEDNETNNASKVAQKAVDFLTKESDNDEDEDGEDGSDEEMDMVDDEEMDDSKPSGTALSNKMVADADDYDFGAM
mmetsp:Transcript_4881/g.7145  ORF Transcript_4881/g.7145 Transcript_4881/m.7145 type:complete len:542 (-) Transcript_4881:49-1674(-)